MALFKFNFITRRKVLSISLIKFNCSHIHIKNNLQSIYIVTGNITLEYISGLDHYLQNSHEASILSMTNLIHVGINLKIVKSANFKCSTNKGN